MQSTITLTFGDCAENHVGMQMIGQKSPSCALSHRDLAVAQGLFTQAGYECKLINLSLDTNEAYILVVKGGAQALLGNTGTTDGLFREQASLDHDKKALMRGKVVNKHARWNLCFGEFSQEPDYPSGMGSVVNFFDVPLTKTVRESIPVFFGPKLTGLQCEGNYYYDTSKCGIGYHGDSERSVVVAVRLGCDMPLSFQWYHRSRPVSQRAVMSLSHGDVYAMSEKAVGSDWKKSSLYTLRHAAGCDKYI